MIFTDRKITIRNGKSSINEPVILYRGDFEVSITFTIMESKFRFRSGVNLVDSEKASYGQLAILAPYGGNVFSEVVKCEDGTVTFTLTKEMIDQLEEVGLYSFQIRLFDYYRESRVSIPPVEFGIEVREPVASEDHDNEVNNAIVGYSIAKVVDGLNDYVGDTFDSNGQYNKTDWETGDRISEGKLNKIEDALDKINQNEIADVAALDKRVTSNFNVLEANVNSKASNIKVDSLETRLSNIIAHNGDGTKDTEIIDARGSESTLGQRISNIDSNGYITTNIIEVGIAKYINSWIVGKGWGTIFDSSSLTDISYIILRKSKVDGVAYQVNGDVTVTLFECSALDITDVQNNAVVLERLTISASEWNGYDYETDISLGLYSKHPVNTDRYYGVTVYNSNQINCSQVGYDTNLGTAVDDTKNSSFLMGIWSNSSNNLSDYELVSANTYGLYIRVKASNSKKSIKIEQTQVEGLNDYMQGVDNELNVLKNIPLERLPLINEYIFTGNMVDTGAKSLQFDSVVGWSTTIKGCFFTIDKVVLNKIQQSNIKNSITFSFYETDNSTDWQNVDPLMSRTMSANEYNAIAVGDFDISLPNPILCDPNKYYTIQVEAQEDNLYLSQSGRDADGTSDVSEYYIHSYYKNKTTSAWAKVTNNYGVYFKLSELGGYNLPKILIGQVEGLNMRLYETDKDVAELYNLIENTGTGFIGTNDNGYIEVYTDDFTSNTNWVDNNSNWIFNNGLTPKNTGDTNVNSVKLNKPYHSDKRIMRFDIKLFSDTVLDINMTRSNDNTGEGESIYRIDIPNKRLIMFGVKSNSRGVDLANLLKVANINFDIINGNKYLIEVEKNDFDYYFRIKDYLTANITELHLKGWGAGRQNHNYGFSWVSGVNTPTITNFKVSMLNNPTCVFAGDSITEGVGMSSIDATVQNNYMYRYAEILRNKIGNCIISAMGGDTIGTIIAKFESEYNHIKPKAISVTIGTNGGVNSNTLEQFKTLIDKSDAIGSKLILNLVPCGSSSNYLGVNENLRLLKQDAEYKDKFILGCQFDVATAVNYYPYVDANHPTTITGGNTRVDSGLMTDNTHPNRAGSMRMADRYAIDVPEIFNL